MISMISGCKPAKKDDFFSFFHKQKMKKEIPMSARAVRTMPAIECRDFFHSFLVIFVTLAFASATGRVS